jgi:NADPH-dependent 2,4-dienoyl-CoA reductase/sulfur reductase-like enzyme
MRTNVPGIFAAGDCVHTYHRVLGADSYLPLGTTAHKQGTVAGENAVGGERVFAGSLGTQVVKVFDLVAARTGLREHEAAAGRFTPVSTTAVADDHKAYYPGARPITVTVTGDIRTGRLLGAQLVGHRDTAVAKRVDTYATALHAGMTVAEVADLDLSYTPRWAARTTRSKPPRNSGHTSTNRERHRPPALDQRHIAQPSLSQ